MTLLTPTERQAWSEAVPDEMLNRTDAGNGEHFARLYGDQVRFDHRRGRWLVWNRHWWREDDTESVRRLAKVAARDRYRRALEIGDLDERKRESGFAIGSENRNRLEAMLTAARSEPPIADAGDRWDADPSLLGVANGIVELHDGRLRSGRPEDGITLHTDIAFDRDAACPRWETFVEEVFDGDEQLVDYVRRAIGYSLTGETSEQLLRVKARRAPMTVSLRVRVRVTDDSRWASKRRPTRPRRHQQRRASRPVRCSRCRRRQRAGRPHHLRIVAVACRLCLMAAERKNLLTQLRTRTPSRLWQRQAS